MLRLSDLNELDNSGVDPEIVIAGPNGDFVVVSIYTSDDGRTLFLDVVPMKGKGKKDA